MLSCSCSEDDYSWFYFMPNDFVCLDTKRRRRCCSCRNLIDLKSLCLKIERYRDPKTFVEDKIYEDVGEVPISPYWLCESCGEIFLNLTEIGYCLDLGIDLRKYLQEYHEISGFKQK